MRTPRLVAAFLALALVAAACGDSEDVDLSADGTTSTETSSEMPGEEVTRATGGGAGPVAEAAGMAAVVDRLDEVQTFRMDFDVSVSAPDVGEAVSIGGSGAVAATGAGRFSFDFSELADLLAAGPDSAGPGGTAPPGQGQATEVFSAMFAEPLELRTDGTTAYLRWGILSMFGLPEGKWLEVPVDEASSAGGFGTGLPGGGNFTELTETLRAAGEVTEVGTETVDGVETTHLRAELSAESLASDLPADQREEITEALGQLGSGTVPVDVFVDDDGLLRRMQMTLDGSVFGEMAGSGGASVTMTIDYSGYGEPVDVELPAPSEVVTEQALNESLMSGELFGDLQ